MRAAAVSSGRTGISTREEGRRTTEGRAHLSERVFSFESRLALARKNISEGDGQSDACQVAATPAVDWQKYNEIKRPSRFYSEVETKKNRKINK